MRQDHLFPVVWLRRFSCAMIVLLAVSTNAPAQTEPGGNCAVQIGVLSSGSAGDASLPWTAVAQYLMEKIPGCAFEIIPLSRDQITTKIHHNAIDFIIVDPVFLAQLKARYGVEAIATLQSRFKGNNFALSGGTLFCLSDKNEIAQPQDLRGRTIAFADKESLPGWLAILREFRNIGFRPDLDLKTKTLGSDESVVAAVLKGEVEAGCVKAGTIERVIAEQKLDKNTFRVIEFKDIRDPNPWAHIPAAVSTRLYPDSSFAACPRAAPDLVKDVASALLAMSQRVPEIVDRPQVVGWTFPRSDLAVHECLQELRLPPYEHFGEISFVEVIRQYMYWFIGAGALMIVMLLVTLYVTALNRALAAEIVERKRAEAALRVSVERFEHIASCSADWIWETDAANCFTYSSSIVEQMLGYRADEIIGKSHFDLFAAAEKERLTTLGQKGLGTGARIFRERFRLLTKDGRVVIQETTAEPIIDSSGQFAGYRGVNRDITNQVRFVRLRP